MATRKPATAPRGKAHGKPHINANGRARVRGQGRGKGGGRPQIEVDLGKLEDMAQSKCPDTVIAAVLGIDHQTLTRRFGKELAYFRAVRTFRLKRVMTRKALAGDTKLLIHIDKTEFGAVERVELTGAAGAPLVPEVSQDERDARAAVILARAQRRLEADRDAADRRPRREA